MLAEHDPKFEESELDCAVCGNDRIIVESDSTVTCPDCRKTYALLVHEEFALMETDGWATRITLEQPDWNGSGRVN